LISCPPIVFVPPALVRCPPPLKGRVCDFPSPEIVCLFHAFPPLSPPPSFLFFLRTHYNALRSHFCVLGVHAGFPVKSFSPLFFPPVKWLPIFVIDELIQWAFFPFVDLVLSEAPVNHHGTPPADQLVLFRLFFWCIVGITP